MNIPQSDKLPTARMSRVFNRTTATYKFYWFIGLLDLVVKRGKMRMSVWDVVIEMVVNAWYPVCYFHLSFGKSDSLNDTIERLRREFDIPINKNREELSAWLHDNISNKNVLSAVKILANNVPYRFLRPWIDTSDDRETVVRSQIFENDCLYRIVEDETMWIEINERWLDYLQANYAVLRDFAYWNLTLFLQVRNPNVPNIPNKLIKQETRNSLARQHEYWDFVISHGLDVHCIYTGRRLTEGGYALDHFIPWSFVSHDLLWNLLPADESVNSSKSDRLPPLDEYLPRLAKTQQQAIRVSISNGFRGKVLEDYLSLGYTAQELAAMDDERICDCFRRTYSPLNQIALNMGFETWNYKR